MRSSLQGIRDTFSSIRGAVPAPYVGRSDSGMPWFGGGGLLGGFSGRSRESELRTMSGNGTIYGIVSQIATGVARPDWHLYKKKTDRRRTFGPAADDRVEVLSHQALTVWNRPNPFMWRQAFVETFQQHLELTGEAWWVVEKTADLPGFGRVPVAMWPVRPDRMAPIPSADDFIAGYVYTAPDGEQVPLEVDDVVFIRMPDPYDIYRGLGPLGSVTIDVESARAAAEWNRNFFRNSALPGGLIEVEKSLSDKEFKQMVSRWRESHKGVGNAHRVGILEQAKWKDRTVSQKDMEFVSLRGMSRDAIREAWAYPSFLLGDMAEANRAGAYAAEFVEARRLLTPRLERVQGALNNLFLPMFGTTAANLEFDYDSPVPDDPETEAAIMTQQVSQLVQLLGAGVDSDEACDLVGLPRLTIEEPETPAQLLPFTAPGTDPAAPPADPNAPPADPSEDDEQDVAARANEILRRNGLAAAVLNGHNPLTRGHR